jgi:hypothetical protein
MERDKTVFISYRRLAAPWAAQAIFNDLTGHGYDVFIDFNGIASGDFEEVIVGKIKARAHFLVLLTPTALERCSDPADLFRREIDAAIAFQRNIVPIMLDGFDFSSPGIDGRFWDTLATLKRYNGLHIYADYFPEAMEHLRGGFLNVLLDTVLHPASDSARNTANEAKKSVGAYVPSQGRDPTQRQRNRTRAAAPYSFLRVSASANTVCARYEGATELMGDVFLRCTYDDDLPSPGPMHVTVELSASAPITSRILDRNVTEVILFEVGRPGAATMIPGVNLGGPGSYEITFSKVHLGDIGPRETRIFQISNLRCDGSCVPTGRDGMSPVFVYVTMTGAPIEDAQQIVATVKRGLEFEVRSADNSGRLADSGFETSRSADLVEQRIATLRFTEGFVNAFKSRAPTFGRVWNTHEWSSASTGESGSRCAVFATDKGAVQVAGLADSGTQLQAEFSNLPAGVRIFVSAHQLGYGGYGGHARLLSPGGEAMMIGDVEARELPIQNGHALAIWEVVTPFYSERSAGFFDFGVFASYVSDPVANLPVIGTSIVDGGFSPQLSAYSSSGPIPMFISTLAQRRCNFLTLVP